MKGFPRLYGIADASFGDPVRIAAHLFKAGALLVQIRDKAASSGILFAEAEAIVELAPESTAVIINDRPDIARLVGARGVHLGQEDLPPSGARKIFPAPGLIGLSTHSMDQALESRSQPVDYVAVGPIFPTTTKGDRASVVGLEGLARISRRLARPVVAIGGIRLEHVEDVLAAGASSVAVISDLIGHDDIERRTRRFLEKLDAI